MAKLRIKVETDLCIGAASCVTVAPIFFALNEENKAFVKDPELEEKPFVHERIIEVTPEQKEEILLAAQSCPTLAILIHDDETGEQLFPAP